MSNVLCKHRCVQLGGDGRVLESTGESLLALVSGMQGMFSNVLFVFGSVELEVVACETRKSQRRASE